MFPEITASEPHLTQYTQVDDGSRTLQTSCEGISPLRQRLGIQRYCSPFCLYVRRVCRSVRDLCPSWEVFASN